MLEDPDGDGTGPALGLLQFKQQTFNYYCREPYTNVKHGFDTLVAFFNIPNALGQINGVTGWSPHGAPITKDKLIISPPNPWGWPFPNVGEGHFSLGQTFGTHPQDGVGRTNGFHDGLDFGSVDHPGRDVHAIHGGKVQNIGYIAGLENYITIVSNDYLICYQEAFLNRGDITVQVGQEVKTGDVIGHRDTSHLHIGITKQKNLMTALKSAWSNDGTWLDPLQVIRDGIGGKETNDVTGWSPHGAPITKDKLIISPPNPWGWPFPNVGEGHFSLGQTFGTHPQDGVGRTNGFHDGLDFGSVDHPGRDVHAIHGGKVQNIGYIAGLENYITIVSNDYLICYQEAFLNRGDITVQVGQEVKTGDVIGHRDTSHLHIGITKQKNLMTALKSAWSNDGTWLDPLQVIRDGIGGKETNDTVGNDTTTESQEEYYFQPFMVVDQKSIDEWGEHPGPDLVDERFQDADAMRKYALTTLKPDPDLNIEVTLQGNSFVPVAGEILRVLARDKYSGSYKTVGYTIYPEAKGQDNQITLNNSKTTILDYQNQKAKRLQEALEEQRLRISGLANSMDQQSKSLTQVVNDKKETDKNMEAVDQNIYWRISGLANSMDQQSKSLTQVVNDKKETDKNMEAVDQNIYWMQNGQHNLVTTMTGGTVSSEKYNDSPVIEIEQGTLRSNEFNLNGVSSISSRLMAKLNATDNSISATTYVEFLKSDSSSAGKSNVVYIINNGAWQSAGTVNIKIPAGTAKGRLIFDVSGSGKTYVSRAQVNLGYRVTDWGSLK